MKKEGLLHLTKKRDEISSLIRDTIQFEDSFKNFEKIIKFQGLEPDEEIILRLISEEIKSTDLAKRYFKKGSVI
jgi:hypothetical protein